MFGQASTGFHQMAVDLAGLGTSALEIVALVIGFLILSSVGGQGIQKPLRQAFMVISLGALFFKSYNGIATGALGLF
jgi:hypothetical protein